MKEPQSWWQKLQNLFKRIGNFFTYEIKAVSDEQTIDPTELSVWQRIRFYFNVTISSLKTVLLILLSFLIVLAGLGIGIGLGYFASLASQEEVPSYQAMKNQIEDSNESAAFYFAKNDKLGNLTTDLIRTPVKSNQISPYLKKAIVATEDEYFYQHHGVVPKAISRALLSDLTGLGTQTGGSTLTQQLVKMKILSSETTFKRKAIEILLAVRLDNYFTKSEILTDYLNAATFGRNNKGQNVGGVEQAALGLFNKHAADLNLAESAFIAGLPQSPSVYTPYKQNGTLKKDISAGLDRKNTVLFRMYRHNDISKSEYDAAKKVDLKAEFQPKTEPQPENRGYGYVYNLITVEARDILIDQLIHEDGKNVTTVRKNKDQYNTYWNQADQLLRQKGYRVHSTIDRKLYDEMQVASKQAAPYLGTSKTSTITDPVTQKPTQFTEYVQNGTVLLDNQSGAVLAFVGGRNFSKFQLNHAFDTKRSPGSSIKPMLVYGPAVQNKLINTQSMIADFPVSFHGYFPTDFGQQIQNRFISASEALAESYNIPAVNLYDALQRGKNTKKYMSEMGIHLSDKEYSELGIALGGTKNGVSVLQQASAFSTFANQGTHVTPHVISKITDPSGKVIYQAPATKRQVFSKSTAYIMQKMLNGVVTKGTASTLSYQLPFSESDLIGKTGTSNDYRDIWFIGSTPGVTMASWIGYDNFYGHNYTLNKSSSDANLTYWSNIISALYKTNPEMFKLNQKMKQPSTVKTDTVLEDTGTKSGAITYNGANAHVTGKKVKAYYNDELPKDVSYQFGIGGTEKNYKLFWNHFFGASNDYGITSTYTGKTVRDPDDSVEDDASKYYYSNGSYGTYGSFGSGTYSGYSQGNYNNTNDSEQNNYNNYNYSGSGLNSNSTYGTYSSNSNTATSYNAYR
ncbi:penicillin-binding protein [Lactobacillus sp. CC-MHH1034]|uniref:transglycosylase domain-containing protein n=1 Tax=Agrilactobacillus fermenti TaxID=2586909 RepID=UPI001E5D6705|nr:transglycosylase domain-containing protein [Agrilactobacillus fermenti]MCD2257229.1 penicillin-binding protein [Agrilactobacillus fermenti]